MMQYRFRTPNRRGKWYESLAQAQHFANAIGAGFLDAHGSFVAYCGTVLELRDKAMFRRSRPPSVAETGAGTTS